MATDVIKGRINSIQSLGTVDGPGIRFVVFTQGCNLRCGCCHNPDTWNATEGTEVTAQELSDKAERYRSYFGKDGGVTLSGGEPILQPEFSAEFFRLCHEKGINTCLDTSGSIVNDRILRLLDVTDRVLLDIKYTDNDSYIKHVGCSFDSVLKFLEVLDSMNIPTVLRTVIIPSLNDTESHIASIKALSEKYHCVEKIELLPFKKICKSKYDNIGIEFPFDKYDIPDNNTMSHLNSMI